MTLIPNVRVQNWYNNKPPYGLRGYLDDRVNRIIGYAIIRQVISRPRLKSDIVNHGTIEMSLQHHIMADVDENKDFYSFVSDPRRDWDVSSSLHRP